MSIVKISENKQYCITPVYKYTYVRQSTKIFYKRKAKNNDCPELLTILYNINRKCYAAEIIISIIFSSNMLSAKPVYVSLLKIITEIK